MWLNSGDSSLSLACLSVKMERTNWVVHGQQLRNMQSAMQTWEIVEIVALYCQQPGHSQWLKTDTGCWRLTQLPQTTLGNNSLEQDNPFIRSLQSNAIVVLWNIYFNCWHSIAQLSLPELIDLIIWWLRVASRSVTGLRINMVHAKLCHQIHRNQGATDLMMRFSHAWVVLVFSNWALVLWCCWKELNSVKAFAFVAAKTTVEMIERQCYKLQVLRDHRGGPSNVKWKMNCNAIAFPWQVCMAQAAGIAGIGCWEVSWRNHAAGYSN